MASSFLLSFTLLCATRTSAYGTCDDQYHIEKYTTATTDSLRDYDNAYRIFPFLATSDTSAFDQGRCAYGMKVETPDTCFKIHAPTTWEHDPGLLDVGIVEAKIAQKWRHVLSAEPGTFNFDAFLDSSMAFWVDSLDAYLSHWESSDVALEFVGIEWHYALDTDLQISAAEFRDNRFYSLLVHSPGSAMHFEFMAFVPPSAELNVDVQWISSTLPRATFLAQSEPFPWNRPDSATIVPVRISQAVTDVAIMVDFYTDVMEAEVLFATQTKDALNGDAIDTQTVFVQALDTQIEIQFVQRPEWYTAGDFSLATYEALLRGSHEEVITTPYCGIDRWFDNHFGFTTWTVRPKTV